jgi:hypothetical protein
MCVLFTKAFDSLFVGGDYFVAVYQKPHDSPSAAAAVSEMS